MPYEFPVVGTDLVTKILYLLYPFKLYSTLWTEKKFWRDGQTVLSHNYFSPE